MLGSPQAPLALAIIACAFGTSCSTKRTVATRPSPYSFDLAVAGLELPDEGVDILYDDEVIGRVKPNAPSARVSLPDEVYLVDAKGRLRVRVEGSCGKQEIPLRVPYADRAEESQALRSATAKPAPFEVDNPAVIRVYYDNDGGEQTTLTIGSRIVHVAAGMVGQTNVVLGSCATSRQVVVGGTRLGELAPQSGTDPIPPTSLVDMIGGHCYRRVIHRYKEDGSQRPPEPRAAAKAAPPPPKGKVSTTPKVEADAGAPKPLEEAVFKGGRIYAVGTVQDLLTMSPPTIAVHDDPRLLTRVELARCDRGKVVAPPPATSAAASGATAAKTPPPKPRAAPRPPPTPKKK